MEEVLHHFIQSVDEAQEAVIESQGNGDLQRFQHAQNLLLQAKEYMREAVKAGITNEDKRFHRAQQLLRKLEETQHAIEAQE